MHVLRCVCLAAATLPFLTVLGAPGWAQAQQAGISFDKRSWSAELSFGDPKYAKAISVNPTASFEFSIDDKGKVAGTVEIAGSEKDTYRGVLDGSLTGDELQISSTLESTAELPSNDPRAAWLHKNSSMPLKLSGRIAMAGSESRVEGSGTLDLLYPDCIIGAIMSERLVDCPKVPVAMTWRATGPAGVGEIEGEPDYRIASRRMQEMREQNRAREGGIPKGCSTVRILKVVGDVEVEPHLPASQVPQTNPEQSQTTKILSERRGEAVALNTESRVVCAHDLITTGMGSSLVLEVDGHVVEVKELSSFIPSTEPPDERTKLWLKAGEVSTSTKKPGPSSGFGVKTTRGEGSTRGTKFTVRHVESPESRTAFSVAEGVVEVTPTNPALPIATVRPGGEVQVTATEVIPTGDVSLVQRPAASSESAALAEPASEATVKNGHPASAEPEAEAPKNGNAALAQAADGHLAGSESEGPTNGHPRPGPGMDMPTNGTPSPPGEGVESEAGPPSAAEPPQASAPSPAACDIAGQWRMDTDNVGQSNWTFTPSGGWSYAAQEQGLGNAAGAAVMNGNAMRMQWQTTGGYSGLVELTIDPTCDAGQGRHIFYTGRTDTQPTRWHRTGAPSNPVPAPVDANADANSEFIRPAPSPIRLQGVVGGKEVTAELTRVNPDTWQWVENNHTFRLKELLDTNIQLIIYDRWRDMFHRLDFTTGETAWRLGKAAGPGRGDWYPHYTIVSR